MRASEFIPATILNVPWKPARILIAVNMDMLIDSAVPMEHKKSVAMARLYAVLRPNVYNDVSLLCTNRNK